MTLLILVLAAASAQDLVKQGNAAMSAGRQQEAVLLYQNAVALRSDSAEAHYDLGRAYYRMGDFSRALDGFERAAGLKRKGRLAAMARYNAGHCMFQQGLGLVYNDPQGALALLEQSLASFLEAPRLDSAMRGDAEHNASVVRKWLKVIEQQLAQQRTAGAAADPPMPGPAAGVEAILSKDKAKHSPTGARVRPMTVGKDW